MTQVSKSRRVSVCDCKDQNRLIGLRRVEMQNFNGAVRCSYPTRGADWTSVPTLVSYSALFQPIYLSIVVVTVDHDASLIEWMKERVVGRMCHQYMA